MVADRVQENRARRAAERQGLRLAGSRRRDPQALDYGTYHLVTADREKVAGPMTLDEVEVYLRTPRDQRGQ